MPDHAAALLIHAEFDSLKTRSTPKQARARQRVLDILNAAVTLLETRPPEDLTASHIARLAGIPVSSVYRYFPTIPDLVTELYLQAADRLKTGLEQAVEAPGVWRVRLQAVLGLIHCFLRDHPYYRPLLILMAAQRGPQSIEHDFNTDVVAFLAARWRAGMDGFTGANPEIVATITVQTILSLEELLSTQIGTEHEAEVLGEIKHVTESYLSLYLSDLEEMT